MRRIDDLVIAAGSILFACLATGAIVFLLTACGSGTTTRHRSPGTVIDGDTSATLTCSSGTNNTLDCSNGQTVVLPPAFPYNKDCNECLVTVVAGIVKVNCPNGLHFEFPLIKGDKGEDGRDGSSCSVGTDGWVRCTDGSSYKLIAGLKGDKGDKGDRGGSCHVSKNSQNQTVISCDDGSTEVIGGCNSCWSFGAHGNVYTLPANTSNLPNLSTLTPEESVTVDNFSMFDRQSSLGFPGLPHRLEWYAIRFTGYILLNGCPTNTYKIRLTSDDGATLKIGSSLVINNDGLHSPTPKVGTITAGAGWHSFTLDYFQGPKTQIALALEISLDNGTTWSVVPKSSLKFEVQ